MINNYPIIDIFEKKSKFSKLSSQMIYGEKFDIKRRYSNWLKIKTKYDSYEGFIKIKKFKKNFVPNYKIKSIKSLIYKKKNKKFIITKGYLPFASKVKIYSKYKDFYEFERNKWIKRNDLKKIGYINKDFVKIFKMFLNVKYKWGGKSFKGIDCSALLQIFFKFNNISIPRDTKDQVKFFKKNINSFKFSKGNLIFWKGHIAICLNNKSLIHAYGPKKKVLIMQIVKTIEEIKNNAKLNKIKIKRINDY
tara:strand:+ start:3742 stop:4488 length:747 start_codon:yes stop_codon:yes gene_type:complete